MSQKQHLADFTSVYPLSKTLRFELIPQGKTLENIENNGLIKEDENRAEYYKQVKVIIDDYHKVFINSALDGLRLNELERFDELYKTAKKDDEQKKEFDLIQALLRKQIAERFSKHPNTDMQRRFKNLFAKELIKEDLKDFVKDDEDKLKIVGEFENFTTYFTGFHENRANMYSAEDKSTAISFRLIHQNLPKFIDNAIVFEKIKNSPIKDKFSKIVADLESIIQVNSIEEMFEINYFNDTLTQLGIDKYNHLLGGYASEDGKTKIQGLNEYINLHNQQTKDKSQRIGKLKPLYKQILSDRNTASFLPEQFKDDAEVLESIEKAYQEINNFVLKGENSVGLVELLKQLPDYDLTKIYIKNDLGLTNISQKLFGTWGVIEDAFNADYYSNYKGKHKIGTEKYEEEQKKAFKKNESFSIAYINECLLLLENKNYHQPIQNYFTSLGRFEEVELTLFDRLNQAYSEVEDVLKTYPENKDLAQDKPTVEKIKALLDRVKDVQHFVKPLLGKGNEAEKDDRFYGDFSVLWKTLDDTITPLYNMVRNYMTKKPYSMEKIKLNFENSYFLNGWAQDYDSKAGLIFEKNGNYFLAINDKKLKEDEKQKLKDNYETNCARRIILDFQKPDNKNIPRLFIRSKGDNYAPAVGKYNLPIDSVIDIYDGGKFKTEYRKINAQDYRVSLHKLIDYFKLGFTNHESYKHYDFQWKPTNEYIDISQFYKDVETSCYQVKEEKINWDTLLNYVNQGKLYLFQIYNKDFSPYAKGTPNMHTLYWRMLFDERNLADVVYKLNGQAEVFWRKSSIKAENKIVHKAKEAIANKNELNTKKQSTFGYDIIKDKRFTVDKFQFHVPITLNFKAAGVNNINSLVGEAIKQNKIEHIIGIDRGERHLLYLTLIDLQGNIKQQFSLNEIVNEYNGNQYRTNYRNLLDKKEGGRDEARKNWQTIETIKELKEGYLSQVIHKIAQLIMEYNAIVVLEDLNMGFMRGRQKVEKQVYQKFEKMLIDKLNYLADKKKNPEELGGVLNALQLTNKFESFQKMGKQSGFLFYVPAWNTSKMDPVTGFVNLFYTKYENVDKAQKFFEKFKSIRYNTAKAYFEFEVDDYSKFNPKAEGTKLDWTICSYGDRILTYRKSDANNNWVNEEVNLTQEFEDFFGKYKITYGDGKCIKNQIITQTDKEVLKGLLDLFKLTVQMRNSITNSEVDYLISPVANSDGEFYHSREAKAGLPKDADANGAYNITRKGMWVVEQIKKAEDLKKLKLAISNKEWLEYVQKKSKKMMLV
ncbi:MAG: type V CRISPR-associated protein Cas12a/Cpf1 [Flavobacteriales bacterium]